MEISNSTARREWGAAMVLLAIAIAIVFGRSVTFDFMNWDDGLLINNNPLVNPPTIHGLIQSWRSADQGLYIPVVYTLWIALGVIGRFSGIGVMPDANGLPPWPFHLANVVVHFANCMLVLVLLRRFLKLPMPAALLGSALFALHPLQVESVAWATAMKDLLSTCFALGGIALYLEAVCSWKDGRGTRGHCAYSASLLLFFIGSLAKPGILGAPIIAAILEIAFIGSPAKAFKHVIAPLLVVLPSAYLTSLAQQTHYDDAIWLIQRPRIALHALGFYLWKVVVPSQLCVDYGLRPLVVVTEPRNLWLMFLPAVFWGLLLVARQHRRELLVVGAVFLAGVAPVLGLVPFFFQFYSTVADRYVYLSMLGPAIGVAFLATHTQRRQLHVALATGILAMSALTFVQVGYWKTSLDIMEHTTLINRRATAAYNNMACYLMPFIKAKPQFATTAPSAPPSQENKEIIEVTRQLLYDQLAADPRCTYARRNLVGLETAAGHYDVALGLTKVGMLISDMTFGQERQVAFLDPYQIACAYRLSGDSMSAAQWLCIGLRDIPGEPSCVKAMDFLRKEQAAASQPATRVAP